ncbi:MULTISPECIES: hypothetical protein [unclassified Agrobacterium]|uniref:hypothetical protein n=1 Tax=unclassified Agrobacterium TaxID=2632611 RepID=UPI00244A5374|nr:MULTISPECIES: hypothetical protein [unclassified Agrobacterium]MDH0615602.1 hypothetical protein [Agrobacterium sp. GD03872]MDH0698741.1 hypothetical protein [Agrobacterium sp. GD03871]MDH1061414.1 hypothetical protein [Agrobacterium sp. GD03992]MDH2212651.1 hypothetical protein [Agrobacterium sp. GD03643]MDH2220996.1 hypothetical protein [Agrobacterium sp. GD03638]
MAILASERLLILACSATKRGEQKYLRAIERYDGPLWRTLRAVDPDGEKAKVAFLSAHLGFRAADTPIEIYDARMTAEMADAMMAGDLGTRWPRAKTQRRRMPSGEHPGMHIYSLRDGPHGPAFSDVALVADIFNSMSCGILWACSRTLVMCPRTLASVRSTGPSDLCAAS